ncbi:MAG: DUF2971 domain-containing protein [Candidatus Thiodiazotropha sp. (ex Lucinoma borealis)]|nr:DUF2971 domain-containing protein [Candidatus Thiodiazotropha sp. (ex Lucinoma borealis)]
MRVYYLTTKEYGLSNIERKWLKASLFDDLNDPFELLAFNMSSRDQRKVWRDFRDYFTREYGLICFSSQWQNPVMWSHYGDKHRGICLGFDVSDQILHKVRYISKRTHFQIGNTLESHGIKPELVSKAVKYKYKEWGYEREYRGMVPLQERDESGYYFVDFGEDFVLKEVLIGARCKLIPQDFHEKLSEYSHKVEVKKTRLAFQSFKVVLDRSVEKYKNA